MLRANPKSLKHQLLLATSVLGFSVSFMHPTFAEDAVPAPAASTAVVVPVAPAAWADSVKISGHVEGGVTFNPRETAGADNLGALFEDKANQVVLNQAMITAQRAIDPASAAFDFGFTLQGMFGTDARYTHGFNEADHLFRGRDQVDIVEASVSAHLPVLSDLFEHGVDVKIGQFPSPMGAEVIDATGNYLYSHSYIFNFGVPYKNTGALATGHVNSILDLFAGLDTGVNAWVGSKGYNNDLVKGQFGFGLNLLEGNLTVLGFSHIGAENPANLVGVPRNALRYLNDITATYKVNPDLTLTTDVNYIADDGLGAIGYGVAQYAVYALNEKISLIARAEVWRDNSGAFVASFPGNFDFVNAERGLPSTAVGGGRTTYGAITLGANFKPDVPKPLEGLVIRPEFRVDDALNGTRPFNNGRDHVSVTPAVDFVFSF